MAKSVKRRVETWPYVLLADRLLPAEQQTVFTLAPLDQGDSVVARDKFTRRVVAPDGTMIVERRTHAVARELCLTNIASVDNFPVGKPKPWPQDAAARVAYLAQLSDQDVMEIGDAIFTESTLAGPEAMAVGNSSAPALTSSSGAE